MLPAAGLLAAAGCGGGHTAAAPAGDVLVSVGDSALTRSEVEARIPAGMSQTDSIELFNAIVRTWLSDMLLADLAASQLSDTEKIERMVADYRNRLIIREYRNKMRSENSSEASEKAVREYYERHKEELLLETPLIRGLYVKIPADAPKLADVRGWVAEASRSSIDKLEKYGLRDAMQYDYFADTWIDFRTVAEHIPYRFYDPDAFVESTADFETSYNGSVYLLHISDFLKSGDSMPFEFAAPRIAEMLAEEQSDDYELRLLSSLFARAREEGRLQTPGFDISAVTEPGGNKNKHNDD